MIEVFKYTDDDWHPSFKMENGTELVSVALHDFKVSVCGNDDDGMEKEFSNYKDAHDCFMRILSLEVINKKDLVELGLIGSP